MILLLLVLIQEIPIWNIILKICNNYLFLNQLLVDLI